MNNIYHTFLAGWCADAAGARLEFRKRKFNEQEVKYAMHFVGEKTNGINDGQFTDDSEMEIALLQGLINGKDDEFFPIEKIAEQYINWRNSNPFDMGQTTMLALAGAENADDMATNAFEYNEFSESNGSLMRCIPISIFSLFKPSETILELAQTDASLTHYSSIVHLTTGIYCFIISNILSLRLLGEKIDNNKLLSDVFDLCLQNNTVKEWFNIGLGLHNLEEYNAIFQEGHVKHAFIFVIYFLKNIDNFCYERAITEVLKCGGDTDTNAKIVGNLFGAYYGDCIPEYMLEKVLNFDCTKSEEPFFRRPKEFGVNHGIELIKIINDKYKEHKK